MEAVERLVRGGARSVRPGDAARAGGGVSDGRAGAGGRAGGSVGQGKQIHQGPAADLVALAALATTRRLETPAETAERLERARFAAAGRGPAVAGGRAALLARGASASMPLSRSERLSPVGALGPRVLVAQAPIEIGEARTEIRVVRERAPGHVVGCHWSQTIPGDRTSVV